MANDTSRTTPTDGPTAASRGLHFATPRIALADGYNLRDVRIDVSEGVHALQGANGAGKSTLLRCLAAVTAHNAQELTWDGHDVQSMSIAERARVRGAVLSDSRPTHALEVLEFISLGSAFHRGRDRITAAANQAETLDISHLIGRDIRRISAGEWAWVRLAQVALRSPSILLLDELDAAIDHDSRLRLYQHVRNVSRTVIAVTHDYSLARTWADSSWRIEGDRVFLERQQDSA